MKYPTKFELALEHGRPLWSLIAVLICGALSSVLMWVFVLTGAGPADGLVVLALVGVLFVVVGTYMRAVAHGNKGLSWLDHLGKLLAVGAAAFAFWGIIGGAAARQEATWLPGLLLSIVIGGLAVLALSLVWLAVRHRASIVRLFKTKTA